MIIHARASAFLESFKMLKAGRKTTEKTEGQTITPFLCSSCSKMRSACILLVCIRNVTYYFNLNLVIEVTLCAAVNQLRHVISQQVSWVNKTCSLSAFKMLIGNDRNRSVSLFHTWLTINGSNSVFASEILKIYIDKYVIMRTN